MNVPEWCQVCGHPARDGDPIVFVDDDPWLSSGTWLHESHTTDPASGFHGAEVAR